MALWTYRAPLVFGALAALAAADGSGCGSDAASCSSDADELVMRLELLQSRGELLQSELHSGKAHITNMSDTSNRTYAGHQARHRVPREAQQPPAALHGGRHVAAAPIPPSTKNPTKGRRHTSTHRSLGYRDKIPKFIWVTGPWKSDSKEVKDLMAKNIGDQPLEQTIDLVQRTDLVRAQIQSYYAKWAPIGSFIRYLTDEDMDDSVRNISTMLAGKGINDVDKAYFNLRPGAFRADVWRLMQLWADGGVYLDVNINLTRPLTDWIDFSRDELVIVTDTGVPNGIWNAMMAAEQRNQYIERAIADITGNILRHYYGNNPLAITGPIALGESVRVRPGYPRGLRRDLEWRGNVGEVTSVRAPGKDEAVVARKDETLHDRDPSKHYDPMWRHKQVYCDQRGPRPDNGKCPVDS